MAWTDNYNEWCDPYPVDYWKPTDENDIAWFVTMGWDEGNMEDGPCWRVGYEIAYAKTKEEAEAKVFKANPNLEGCSAELATPEQIKELEDYLKEWEAICEEIPFN